MLDELKKTPKQQTCVDHIKSCLSALGEKHVGIPWQRMDLKCLVLSGMDFYLPTFFTLTVRR